MNGVLEDKRVVLWGSSQHHARVHGVHTCRADRPCVVLCGHTARARQAALETVLCGVDSDDRGGALHDAKVVRDGVWVGQICTPASRWIVVGAVVVRIHLSSHKATV